MLLARFLQSLSGTCRYCGQQTGLLQRDHPECRQTHQAGFTEMVRSPPKPPVPTPSTRPHYGSWLGASPALGSLLHRPTAGTTQEQTICAGHGTPRRTE